MNGPTQEEVQAEHEYRSERAREVFAAGRVTCGGMRLQVSGKEVRRLRSEVERRQKERDAAKRAFERYKDHSAEITYVRAQVALEEAVEAYRLARAAR